jgi:cellulose synthase/poly-beta-1,6-N-acetylglucosamine synthase-like glycosyltransferase
MWLIPLWITVILVVGNCVLILLYYGWFVKLQYFKPRRTLQPQNHFTIIIPARNEEDYIEQCLLSILQNDYPSNLFEIIVADDFSTDNTIQIVQKLQQQFSNLKLVQLQKFVTGKLNSYKKKSIETAIIHSSYDWIITTDADCKVSYNWLSLFNSYIQKNNVVFIAAPVKFINDVSFLSIFQCLDFISLQGITAASVSAGFHNMCNGANLAYKKEAFYDVNGFKDVDNIASGDDMLLMHKIEQRYPGKIGYLFNKEAIVETAPMRDWKSFINQRIRWASKATSYSDKKIFLVLLLVYLTNLCLFLLPFLSFLNTRLLFYWVILLLIKTSCEFVFMLPVAKFFGQQKLLWWFPIMQPFHILYTVVSGWLGKFGKYEWKGRIVK